MLEGTKIRLGHAANLALARRPAFVVLATPRSGTAFIARYLTEIGIRCAHEGYFTPEGPTLRNRNRRFGGRGDASWMAVPFAARLDMVRLHQVREPLAVVRSLVKIGLFNPRLRERYRRYMAFLDRHFEPSDDPLESSLRFYLNWNARAEAAAQLRYRVEDVESALPDIVARIGARPRRSPAAVPTDTNSREPALGEDWDSGLDERLRAQPLFAELNEMRRRYGYR